MNMVALWSFGPTAFNYLENQRYQYPFVTEEGRVLNWDTTYHHIAFYATVGLVANLGSHAINVLYRLPRSLSLIQQLGRANGTTITASALAATPGVAPILPGLGASGAIYGCLTVSALAHPDFEVLIYLFPFVSFKIGPAVLGLVALDAVGVLRGWRLFDHWVHLTGAAVGMAAFNWEPRAWFELQKALERGRMRSFDGGKQYRAVHITTRK